MKNMQAVVLAAGESSRFYPFNNNSHKSAVKIMGKPIIVHTIESIKKSGITDVIVVIGKTDKVRKELGDGKKFGLSIKFVLQEKPKGMGDALLRCQKFIKNDFFLLHSSHLDFDEFSQDLLKAKKDALSVLLAKKKTGIMQGMLRFEGKKVEGIIEKPKKGEEPSNLGVVGIYLFDKSFLNELAKTPKEHYMLEKAISEFASKNFVTFVETSKETVSLKYPWDLLAVKDYLLKKIKRSVSKNISIAKSAEIVGNVIIEEGVKIMEGVRIKGPCFIGKNAVIGNNALLRGGMSVEENSIVGGFMEMKNTVFMRNSTAHSGFIGDSIIGENCKIAAQFCTGNLRLDRKIIKSIVRNEEVETGLKYLGAIIGANTNIGIKVSTMPGVIIGRHVTIGPSTVVMKNIPDNTKYYTKFQEVISLKNE